MEVTFPVDHTRTYLNPPAVFTSLTKTEIRASDYASEQESNTK